MKSFLSTILFLSILSGCGEDVGSNNTPATNGQPTINIPGTESTDEPTQLIRSHMHREKGNVPLSYQEEILLTLSGQISNNIYRILPLMESDNEGGLNVLTVQEIGRPASTCGESESFPNINARITDCQIKNGAKAIWKGTENAAAGESTWKLVLKTPTNEVWLDSRTNMVWSEIVSFEEVKSFNWCQASGNTQGGVGSVNCSTTETPDSLCAGASYYNFGTQVKWRLPTRNDFLQADINGLRFVLKDEGSSGLWTATMKASSVTFSEAWVYRSNEGTLSASGLLSLHSVRCIGVPSL